MRHILLVSVMLLSSCSLFSPSYPNVANPSLWQTFNVANSVDSGWLVFGDTSAADTGFVFYPGGKVEPDAYGEFANALAQQLQIVVVIVPMPLDLAVLGAKRGNKVQQYFPNIETWLIGGHSLGGTMAANLAYKQEADWQGLLLLASYPQEKHDFSSRNLAVISIIGEQDGLISQERWQQSLKQLPTNATTVIIDGGNHAGFGTYGQQADDNPATISNLIQLRQTLSAVEFWLDANF